VNPTSIFPWYDQQCQLWDYEMFELLGTCVTPPDGWDEEAEARDAAAAAAAASAVSERGGESGGGVFALTATGGAVSLDGLSRAASGGGGDGNGIKGRGSRNGGKGGKGGPKKGEEYKPSGPRRAVPVKVCFLDPYPLLAAACDDRTVRLWHVPSCTFVGTLVAPPPPAAVLKPPPPPPPEARGSGGVAAAAAAVGRAAAAAAPAAEEKAAGPVRPVHVPFTALLWAPAPAPLRGHNTDPDSGDDDDDDDEGEEEEEEDGGGSNTGGGGLGSGGGSSFERSPGGRRSGLWPLRIDRIFAADAGGRVVEWRFAAHDVGSSGGGEAGEDGAGKRWGQAPSVPPSSLAAWAMKGMRPATAEGAAGADGAPAGGTAGGSGGPGGGGGGGGSGSGGGAGWFGGLLSLGEQRAAERDAVLSVAG